MSKYLISILLSSSFLTGCDSATDRIIEKYISDPSYENAIDLWEWHDSFGVDLRESEKYPNLLMNLYLNRYYRVLDAISSSAVLPDDLLEAARNSMPDNAYVWGYKALGHIKHDEFYDAYIAFAKQSLITRDSRRTRGILKHFGCAEAYTVWGEFSVSYENPGLYGEEYPPVKMTLTNAAIAEKRYQLRMQGAIPELSKDCPINDYKRLAIPSV